MSGLTEARARLEAQMKTDLGWTTTSFCPPSDRVKIKANAKDLKAVFAALDAQAAEIERLREALEPWAALGRACDDIATHIPINAYVPNLRQAASLLTPSQDGEG